MNVFYVLEGIYINKLTFWMLIQQQINRCQLLKVSLPVFVQKIMKKITHTYNAIFKKIIKNWIFIQF